MHGYLCVRVATLELLIRSQAELIKANKRQTLHFYALARTSRCCSLAAVEQVFIFLLEIGLHQLLIGE
jgi:hypothetical protein